MAKQCRDDFAKGLYSVSELAELLDVTPQGVRYWIKKGLPYRIEKVIGIKPRMVIDGADVIKFLDLGIRDLEDKKS